MRAAVDKNVAVNKRDVADAAKAVPAKVDPAVPADAGPT
jgi:hypothetical protein